MANQKRPSFSISSVAIVLLQLVLAITLPLRGDCFGLDPNGGSSSLSSTSTSTSISSRRVGDLTSPPAISSFALFASSNENTENSISSSSNSAPFFSPEELVAMTKDYLANPSPDWWADDFVFRGPVIGPLCKNDLVATLGANSELQTAFPDLQANAFGFCADDPIEPMRVWYFVRPRGSFSGPFTHPTKGLIEPTNAPYIAPPEVRSVVFDSSGTIRYQTVGYVADRFTGDTTGGRGAVFGQYAVMGEELESNPGSWTLLFLQKLSEYLPDVPKSYSKPEDVPGWWTDERRGAEA